MRDCDVCEYVLLSVSFRRFVCECEGEEGGDSMGVGGDDEGAG